MLIVTSNGIPGYRIEAVLGEVMGMTVRSTNLGAKLSASMSGGEQEKFTRLAYDSRNEVMSRMWAECTKRGGNAIVAMKFDTGEIAGSFTEVCAYGTAVVAVPLDEGEPGATPQSIERCRQARAYAQENQPGPGNWPTMPGAAGQAALDEETLWEDGKQPVTGGAGPGEGESAAGAAAPVSVIDSDELTPRTDDGGDRDREQPAWVPPHERPGAARIEEGAGAARIEEGAGAARIEEGAGAEAEERAGTIAAPVETPDFDRAESEEPAEGTDSAESMGPERGLGDADAAGDGFDADAFGTDAGDQPPSYTGTLNPEPAGGYAYDPTRAEPTQPLDLGQPVGEAPVESESDDVPTASHSWAVSDVQTADAEAAAESRAASDPYAPADTVDAEVIETDADDAEPSASWAPVNGPGSGQWAAPQGPAGRPAPGPQQWQPGPAQSGQPQSGQPLPSGQQQPGQPWPQPPSGPHQPPSGPQPGQQPGSTRWTPPQGAPAGQPDQEYAGGWPQAPFQRPAEGQPGQVPGAPGHGQPQGGTPGYGQGGPVPKASQYGRPQAPQSPQQTPPTGPQPTPGRGLPGQPYPPAGRPGNVRPQPSPSPQVSPRPPQGVPSEGGPQGGPGQGGPGQGGPGSPQSGDFGQQARGFFRNLRNEFEETFGNRDKNDQPSQPRPTRPEQQRPGTEGSWLDLGNNPQQGGEAPRPSGGEPPRNQ